MGAVFTGDKELSLVVVKAHFVVKVGICGGFEGIQSEVRLASFQLAVRERVWSQAEGLNLDRLASR